MIRQTYLALVATIFCATPLHVIAFLRVTGFHSTTVSPGTSPPRHPLHRSPTRNQRAQTTTRCRTRMVMAEETESKSIERDDEKKSIIVVGLNGALQRTIVFSPPKGLRIGGVNRAASVGAGIGGKGQNVCVALQRLAEAGGGDVDVTLAHFAGGKSGEAVCEMLGGLGIHLVTSETEAEMRLCTTLIDERLGETTEIIEPWSAEAVGVLRPHAATALLGYNKSRLNRRGHGERRETVTPSEQATLIEMCRSTVSEIPKIHGVAVMGSSPAGVGRDTLANIMGVLAGSGGFMGSETRVLVDSVIGFQALVDSGHVSLLKVNAEELVQLAESGREDGSAGSGAVSVWMEDKLENAAVEMFERYGSKLPWIAVTNGGLPSYLFSGVFLREDSKLSSFWRLTPAPVEVINPIGAGDAVAAATLHAWTRGSSLPEAFRRGLAVGGACCMSRDPLCNSCFSYDEAKRVLADVKLEQIERG